VFIFCVLIIGAVSLGQRYRDWNATLDSIDKKGGISWKPTAYWNGIISMMEELDLIDIFRGQKPHTKSFS